MKSLLLAALSAVALSAQSPLYDRYFNDYYFRFNPTAGTAAGFHQYDKQLEDYSAAAVQSKITALHSFEAQFAKEPASPDRDLVLSRIRADLLELESVKMWQKNPDFYSSGVTGSIFTIMSRKFAPQPERLESVIAREKQIPGVLEEARKNLQNPPRVYTEVAIEQLPGITGFFEKDVPLAFNEVTDADLSARFKASNQAVIDALNKYLAFLKTDMLPRSNGDFRIGAENYRKKLLYEEMVDIPLDRLLTIGYADLHKNQEAFRKVAAEIDPNRTPQQILDSLEKDHPPASGLLQSFRDILSGLKAFIEQHQIIDIPSPVLPIVEETPPFERALTTASMDTPGPFEKVATEAFFNVTLPDPGDSAKDTEEYMESFNRGTIASTAIHEAYPGHYVQFLWVQHAPNQVRKLLGAGSNAEGWAHYCEQMLLDEGYGDKQLRIGQLQDALLRNARYIAGIEMHTGKMTMDQAREFFVKEGYQTKPIADKETKRGTSDPTYLMYTLGKLEIMKLRADYKTKMGDKFTLKDFHDNFMKQGFPPIKIVREAMLGPDSGPTL